MMLSLLEKRPGHFQDKQRSCYSTRFVISPHAIILYFPSWDVAYHQYWIRLKSRGDSKLLGGTQSADIFKGLFQ